MPGTRLVILGAIAAALVLLIVIGSAALALGDSYKQVRRARQERAEREDEVLPPPARPRPVRYTPERTRLHWYSPEIIAVLLLTLAAGLWLARLVGQ